MDPEFLKLENEEDDKIFITSAYEVTYNPNIRGCSYIKPEEIEGLVSSLLKNLINENILFRLVRRYLDEDFPVQIEILNEFGYSSKEEKVEARMFFSISKDLQKVNFYKLRRGNWMILEINNKNEISEIFRRENKNLIGCRPLNKDISFYNKDIYVLVKLIKRIISEKWVFSEMISYSEKEEFSIIKENNRINIIYDDKAIEGSHYRIHYETGYYDLFYFFFFKNIDNLEEILNCLSQTA